MTAAFFNQVKLDDTQAKGRYGIGLQIGQQLLDSQLAVKTEAVAKGIYDVLNQHAPVLDFNEISQALQQLQQQAAEAQQAQFKEIEAAGKAFLEANKQKDGVKMTDSGLQYEVLIEGDGTVFDSSVTRGQPAEFPVNGVVKGWVEALSMMPVGSKWRLAIPHELAYGERGAGAAIPPFSPLVFEVELLDIL